MYFAYTISMREIHNDTGEVMPVHVERHFKALPMIGALRRRPSRSFFPSGLSWQVGEDFSAVEVDAVRIDVDHQASQARPPANQRCAAITEYLDILIAAVLSGSADLAPPKVDHAARTPLFLAIQVAM
ncbi:hypothetical protein HFN63_11875 [Rhizobium leguminosarum]|nr:hypothetical protein [Rhizobium leguminosarum]